MHRIFRAFLILGLLTFATACQGQRSPSDQEIRQAVLQQIQGYALESLNHEVFPGTEGPRAYRLPRVHSPGAHSLPRHGIDRVPLPQ